MDAAEQRNAWIARVLGVRTGQIGSVGAADRADTAMADWTARRAGVVGTLRALEAAIRDMDHPLASPAIIQLRAIVANLTPVPDTAQKVAELSRYLTTDQVIDDAEEPNGFDIEVRIRAELLPVLERLSS